MTDSVMNNNSDCNNDELESKKALLHDYVSLLKERYKDNRATTYAQLTKENRDIPFQKIRVWIKDIYDITAASFFTNEGVITTENEELSEAEQLSMAVVMLKEKYRDKPATTLAQIRKENRKLPISKVEKWSRSVFGMTAKDYLVSEGVILDLKSDLSITNEQYLFSCDELEYMRKKLILDFYYIEDVKNIYIDRFGDVNIGRINTANMDSCGYKYYTNYIVKDIYLSATDYFVSLIIEKEIVDLNEFDKRIAYDNYFRRAINELSSRYDYLEYEKWKYISFNRCSRVVPQITKTVIKAFVDDSIEMLDDNEYISIKYIQDSGYNSILFSLGFSDWFSAALIKNSNRVGYFRIGDVFIFYKDITSKKDKQAFISDLLAHVSSIEVDDLVSDLYNDYGISLSRNRLISLAKESNLYYDKIMDKIYYKKEFYYDEL